LLQYIENTFYKAPLFHLRKKKNFNQVAVTSWKVMHIKFLDLSFWKFEIPWSWSDNGSPATRRFREHWCYNLKEGNQQWKTRLTCFRILIT